MKNMRTMIVFAATVFAFFGCGQNKEQASGQAYPNSIEKVSIKVESAQCGMCASTIEDALNSVDGVRKAEVDLDSKEARVEFLAAKADLGRLEIAITKAGYDANEKKADPEAYEKLDACCKVTK